jgi:hypothetical protein
MMKNNDMAKNNKKERFDYYTWFFFQGK